MNVKNISNFLKCLVYVMISAPASTNLDYRIPLTLPTWPTSCPRLDARATNQQSVPNYGLSSKRAHFLKHPAKYCFCSLLDCRI